MTAQELVKQVKDLPSISPVVARLISMLNDLDISNDAIVDVVRHDPTLTARLLQLCNSAQRAARQSIASVDEAIFRLGRGEIMKAVMEMGVGQTLRAPLEGYAVEAKMLWKHSLATAMLSESLAKETNCPNSAAAAAFTAGLLHDIGKVVLNEVLTPELQTDIRQRIESGDCSWVEAERTVIGVDHAAVGAALLNQWALPECLVEATAKHHTPECHRDTNLPALVHVADCLAHMSGCTAGWCSCAQRVDETVALSLGLNEQTLERLLTQVPEQVTAIEESLRS